jgi:hypothetical protein
MNSAEQPFAELGPCFVLYCVSMMALVWPLVMAGDASHWVGIGAVWAALVSGVYNRLRGYRSADSTRRSACCCCTRHAPKSPDS